MKRERFKAPVGLWLLLELRIDCAKVLKRVSLQDREIDCAQRDTDSAADTNCFLPCFQRSPEQM